MMMTSSASEHTVFREMLQLCDVWFYGEGPDNALQFEWQLYLKWLARQGNRRRLSHALIAYVRGKEMREWYSTLSRVYSRGTTQEAAGEEAPRLAG
jgi:hypothetical protein